MKHKKTLKDRGFTLLETVVVMGIAAIITGIAVYGFQNIKSSTKIRTNTSDVYGDMLSTQIASLTKKRMFFIVFGANNYTTYEDTYNAASPTSTEGDGILQTAQDANIGTYPKNPYYTIVLTTRNAANTNDSVAACDNTICFDSQGLFSFYKTSNNLLYGLKAIIHFNFTNLSVAPEYSCIVIEKTRILKGEWISANNVCAAK
jgi:prepilin-type N-terminal cleavage/methylation domain-containing protein